MKIQIFVLASLMSLSACGDEPADNATSSSSKASSNNNVSSAVSSKLNAFMSEDRICDVLSEQQIQSLLSAPSEIEKSGVNFRNTYSCSYTWPRADKAEREKNLVSSMMAARSGEGPKLTMRDRMFDHQLTISLKKSQRSADSFVPRKQSEEEIKRQIEAARERTEKRLTDEQKAVAGDAANTMIESMLRKANQNEEVPGIGDAAFISKLGTGSLEVLDGDVHITVSPMIADTKDEDLANAKKIALALVD